MGRPCQELVVWDTENQKKFGSGGCDNSREFSTQEMWYNYMYLAFNPEGLHCVGRNSAGASN